MIMMGAHILAWLETHPSIVKHWIMGLDMSLKSFVTLDRKKEIKYSLEQIKWDNPFYRYKAELFEEGKNEPFAKGFIYTTDIPEVFKIESEKKIAKLTYAEEKPKIADLSINKKIISPYCQNIHLDESIYKQKYGDKVSGMIPLFKVIGKLYNCLATGGKTHAYSGQRYDALLTSLEDENLTISGEKGKPKTFRGVEFTNLELLITGNKGPIARSTTTVSAFS
jgi:hypothetical protein